MGIRLQQWPTAKLPEERTPFEEVLGVEGGGSPYGSSVMKGLRICPRSYALKHIVGLTPEVRYGDDPIDVGLLFHHALCEYYRVFQRAKVRTTHLPTKREAEREAYRSLAPFRTHTDWEEPVAEVEHLLAAYFEGHAEDDFEVLAAEWTLIARRKRIAPDGTIQRIVYSARLDTVVRCHTRGGIWILEHKSMKQASATVLEGYQMDLQIVGQVQLVHWQRPKIARHLRGVIIDIITRHKTPQLYRVEVCPSPQHRKAFVRSLYDWEETKKLWERLGWPMAFGNCSGGPQYFKKCQFFDVCHGHPLDTVEDFLDKDPPFGWTKRTRTC